MWFKTVFFLVILRVLQIRANPGVKNLLKGLVKRPFNDLLIDGPGGASGVPGGGSGGPGGDSGGPEGLRRPAGGPGGSL